MSNSAYNNTGFVGDNGKGGKESHEKSRSVELSIKSTNGFQASDDYEPYAHRDVQHPLTNMETTVHLLKCALGTGIFAMPNAFNHAGYVVGFIGTVILGSIATYCVHIL
ncbi:proton-coupled amino acid transporter-like protein CG1139, partial [Sitodiplosis mosellana]|uniref:proton-coupled amino acid transporter-like protein CG1139 n=1 Tax=Sitodiplosis mosellana TaxID=263140 RepID=UPI002444708D